MTEQHKPAPHDALNGFSLRYEDLGTDTEIGAVLTKANEISKDLVEGQRALEKLPLDDKTGLLKYSAFQEKVKARIEGANRRSEKGKRYALIWADLDDFGMLNDEMPYETVDDEYLIPTAEILKKETREETDLVARFGGEEYVILLSDVDKEAAEIVADKIREHVNSLQTKRGPLGISMGIALFEQGTLYDDASKPSNDVLKEAKKLPGKNQTVFVPAD